MTLKRVLAVPAAMLAALAVVLLTFQVPASATGDHPAWWCPVDDVCLYANLNGEGAITTLNQNEAGRGVEFPAGGRNDTATSISTNAGNVRDSGNVFYFYQSSNCTGARLTVSAGYHINDLRTSSGWNDNISSFAIAGYTSGLGPCFYHPTYTGTASNGTANYVYNDCPPPDQGFCPFYMFGYPD
jgi:hypothetical protein